MANFRLGLNGKMYLGDIVLNRPTVVEADVTWTEQSNVRDLTLSLETSEADVTTRANDGWRATASALKDASVEFAMVLKDTDVGFTAIRNAFLNNTEISAAIMDGDITVAGNEGLVSNFNVTGFTRREPLEEAIMYDVVMKPSGNQAWYEVASS